ncbi:MAG TPA: N-acetylmuramoyl-L-alanine amidase [Alphaproteobacteria bacterium]|nr:N-acetylmuramoyl-L-alanine amidase [Alphaproteobacteria bacterium]
MAAPVAENVRLGVHGERTRLVVDLSERVDFSVFTLADPYRVVIDLPQIDWQVPNDAMSRAGGLIDSLRFGHFRPGKSRVVIDLSGPARVSDCFLLPPTGIDHFRLVMDLEPATRSAFLAAVSPPTPPPSTAGGGTVPPVPALKPRPAAGERFVIVLDPGHGGVDPGAIGLGGTYEKAVTLAFAMAVRAELRERRNYRVYLTRDDDTFIPLRERVAIARRRHANLFISIHADTIANPAVRGGGVYTLSETASDKEAAELAARENRSDLIAGVNLDGQDDDVASILLDLTQRETMNYSARFAGALVPELRDHVAMRARPHRFAGFRVLKAPDVPSVLIELGYLSNRTDEHMLLSPRSRAAIARSIARAVDRYVDGLGG